jgi:hypothetical protein
MAGTDKIDLSALHLGRGTLPAEGKNDSMGK